MPTRIFLNTNVSPARSIVVSETVEEVTKKIEDAKNSMDVLVFYDNENRYNIDRRVMVVSGCIEYFRPERVSI